MSKEFFEKNRLILDKIKAKFPNNIKKLGDPLDDPILSPYTYPFIFLADRDPTGYEPNIYTGFAGLILIWKNETTGDFFISPDNTASPLIWNKIITDVNINSVLYKVTGIATLSLGSTAVLCPSIATDDIIQVNYKTASGIPGAIFVSSVTPGTGFTVQSTSLLDTGVIQWRILN